MSPLRLLYSISAGLGEENVKKDKQRKSEFVFFPLKNSPESLIFSGNQRFCAIAEVVVKNNTTSWNNNKAWHAPVDVGPPFVALFAGTTLVGSLFQTTFNDRRDHHSYHLPTSDTCQNNLSGYSL